MVGGGLVLDDQTFPRFNECGMIDFAGYTVTADQGAVERDGPADAQPAQHEAAQWLKWAAETYPEAVKNTAIVFGDIDTTKNVAAQLEETMKASGWTVKLRIPVALGEANCAPFAQQLKDNNITALSNVGRGVGLALCSGDGQKSTTGRR